MQCNINKFLIFYTRERERDVLFCCVHIILHINDGISLYDDVHYKRIMVYELEEHLYIYMI